jgi:hypothetical protein
VSLRNLNAVGCEHCFRGLLDRLLRMKPNRRIGNPAGLDKDLGYDEILACFADV